MAQFRMFKSTVKSKQHLIHVTLACSDIWTAVSLQTLYEINKKFFFSSCGYSVHEKSLIEVASYTDILWVCRAIFLPHKYLLKPREHSLLLFACIAVTAADFAPKID